MYNIADGIITTEGNSVLIKKLITAFFLILTQVLILYGLNLDNFRLELIREINAQVLKTQLADLIREAQELYDSTQGGTAAGKYPQTARSTFQAAVPVISLSGNILHNTTVVNQETRIALPSGLYIIAISLDGQNKVSKVLVM